MNKKSITSYSHEKEETVRDEPLSSQELASLIKASQDKGFNAVEIKKEENAIFKKVSLHEIAKKAQKEERNISSENLQNDTPKKDTHSKENNEKNTSKSTELDKSEDEIAQKIGESDKIEDETDKKEETKDNGLKEKYISEAKFNEELAKAKEVSFEEGRKKAFDEIKEGSDAAIASLKKVVSELSAVDKLDLSNYEKQFSEKILELSSELSGKIITALPSEFLKKIKSFLVTLENVTGDIEIFINKEDYKSITKSKDLKNELSRLKITSNDNLNHGEIELRVNGIVISQKLKNSSIQ